MPIYAGAISAVPTRSSVKNLLVYGTLMDKRLLYQITGKYFSTFSTVLRRFKKIDSHLGYPYILPYKTSKVEGLLIKNIDPEIKLYRPRGLDPVVDQRGELPLLPFGNPIGFVPAASRGV